MREVATSQGWNLTWDIGANNGRYSRIAAEGSRNVLAVDADQGPIELLYRSLRDEGDEKILTLTMNLADPSPGLGWRGAGAQGAARPRQARPGAALWRSSTTWRSRANVPVAEFVDWLASLGTLARNRVPHARGPDGPEAARPQTRGPASRLRARELRALLARAFDVERRERLASGHPRPVLRAAQGRRSARSTSLLPRADGWPRGRRVAGDGRRLEGQGRAAGLRASRGALDLRARPAAVQPPLATTPSSSRRAGRPRPRHHRVRGPAGGAAAGDPDRGRAAGRPGQRRAPRGDPPGVHRRPGRRDLRPGPQEVDRPPRTRC